MESWILYALVAGVFIGIANFYGKIIAAKGLNKNRILFYSQLCGIVIPLGYLGIQLDFTKFTLLLGLVILIRTIAAVEKGLFIVEGLKYIETGLFFPIHRIFHVFLVFFVGMIAFGEHLSFTQGASIFFGVISILLLNTKENKNNQFDYRKGIVLLLVANLLRLISSTINKYITHVGFDISTYVFLAGVFGSIYMLITKRDIFKKVDRAMRKEEVIIGLVRGSLLVIGFFLFLYALKDGPFVLVQMLVTLSVFIPIILSTIFFNEKINKAKLLAFALFILAVYLISI